MNIQRIIITNMLAKIDHKPAELYVINRIWHKLDDIRVRFVLQQYVKRKDGYALADLYLPQVKKYKHLPSIISTTSNTSVSDNSEKAKNSSKKSKKRVGFPRHAFSFE